MKTMFLIIITVSLFVPLIFNSAYAEETKFFDMNGYAITTNSSNIVEINLSWGNGVLPHGSIVFDKVIKDRIHIQIPKEMPRTTNLDFGVGLYAIQFPRHAELLIEQTESDCFYHLSIPVRNSDEIKITSVSPAAGRTVTVVVHDCEETEIITLPLKTQLQNNVHIKQIQCKNNSHVLAERPNYKVACVYPTTADYWGWKIISFLNPFPTTLDEILDHCNRTSLGLEVDHPYLQYENETHIITNDTCEWRKMHIRGNAGD